MKPTLSFILLFVLTPFFCIAQDSIATKKTVLDISGYLEAYYSYDFGKPKDKTERPFLYNYNRHNEFNINMALLRASVSYENVYAKLSVHAGTYVQDNYAVEDLKFVNEALLGIYFNASQKTNMEVGIMPSYIGFETATSSINLTATRSILAENTPYYMTGIKLNHQFNNKFTASFLITNGWQRIQKANNKVAPSFGTQISYKIKENSLINWSTFVGKEYNGVDFTMRYFSNLYWDTKWNDRCHTILGFDYGTQEISSSKDVFKKWWSPVLINQYSFTKKIQIAHRIEYYQDKNNIIIATKLPFETVGNSINFDFLPNPKTKIRLEGKWYRATEPIFENKKDNFALTSTISFEF